MAIAERIHFFRNLRGLTQKALGLLLEMQLPALCANLLDFTLKAHAAAVVILLAVFSYVSK